MNKKCYSRNQEDYTFDSVDEVLQEMADYDDLKEGAVFWEADSEPYQGGDFFSADDVIESAQQQAYDAGGEWAEDFGADIPADAVAELDSFLKEWANKHCPVNFWRVRNEQKITVTAEMVAEYALSEAPK